jgi:Na+/H+ antiporter NhaD/arsenite permease-like protein
LGLPLTPLIWALVFGTCLGGNGTLIGASANVVAVGLAEAHGYRISFWQFLKFGFPVLLLTVFVASFWLIFHALVQWW